MMCESCKVELVQKTDIVSPNGAILILYQCPACKTIVVR